MQEGDDQEPWGGAKIGPAPGDGGSLRREYLLGCLREKVPLTSQNEGAPIPQAGYVPGGCACLSHLFLPTSCGQCHAVTGL
jgi:hypothetical protein